MIRFFSKFKDSSVTNAKSRLKSVISDDRINLSENITAEKIRKDVTAVLVKYAGGNSQSVKVIVKKHSHSQCYLEATVSVDTA